MKRVIYFLVVLGLWLGLNSCGGGGGSSSVDKKVGYAMLGNLADAKVEIYEVKSDGSLNLKWEEKSSNANSLSEIGKFYTHANELQDNTFYLYKVIGGKDWDKNDDNIKDNNYTIHSGIIRALAKGSDIKKAGNNFKVTILSEMLYKRVANMLKNYNTRDLNSKINQECSKLIPGAKDIGAIITYDPKNDNDNLSDDIKLAIDIELHQHYFGIFSGVTLNKTLATLNIGDRVNNTINYGDYLFVLTENNGVLIYNISNLDFIMYVSKIDIYGLDSAVVSDDGNYIYITTSNGLEIYNISDINNPTFVSKLNYDFWKSFGLYNLEISNDGNKLFIAGGKLGLIVVDISDKNNPTQIARYDTNKAVVDVKLSSDNSKAYIADYGAGLKVLNISNLNNIALLAEFTQTNGATSVALLSNETKAYVADYAKGLFVLDISNLSNITKVKQINSTHGYDVKLSLDQNTAYFLNDRGVDVINLSNYSIAYTLKVNCSSNNMSMDIDKTKLFVGNIGSLCNIKGVEIIDLN